MAMENKGNLQCNNVFHLEDSIIMYSIYSSDILEKLINSLHEMCNTTTWNEIFFTCNLNNWFQWYLSQDGVGHNSLLYLRTLREKYVKMYEKFIVQLYMYAKQQEFYRRVIYLFQLCYHQNCKKF